MAGEHAERAGHDVPPTVSESDDVAFQIVYSVQVHGVADVSFGLVFEQDAEVIVDVDAGAHGPNEREKVVPMMCLFVAQPLVKPRRRSFLQHSPRCGFALFQSAQSEIVAVCGHRARVRVRFHEVALQKPL